MRVVWFLLSCATIANGYCAERLYLDAEVNGKPVRLCFDTGSDRVVLFKKTAERLGLKITELPSGLPQPPGKVAIGRTEECNLKLEETTVKSALAILDSTAGVNWDFDGLVGWSFLSHNVIYIDAETLRLYFLASVPKEVATWIRLDVLTNYNILALRLPEAGNSNGVLLVDTGSPRGVALAQQEWKSWRSTNATQPLTLEKAYDPAGGWFFSEEAWAKQISLGALKLTELPVSKAFPTSIAIGTSQYVATLGLAALKRVDLVVDAESGNAYLRSKVTKPPQYEYNRLGAIFIPTGVQNNDLVAHVVVGSPAYKAGIRDGDMLLKIDGADVTAWRSDPTIEIDKRFRSPAGTKLKLTLRRSEHVFETTAALREILSGR